MGEDVGGPLGLRGARAASSATQNEYRHLRAAPPEVPLREDVQALLAAGQSRTGSCDQAQSR